jgi:hypothetical protein
LLAVVACHDDKRPPKRYRPSTPIDAAPSDATGFGVMDATELDATVDAPVVDEPPGPFDVILTDDKQTVHATWGVAFYGADGVIVYLHTVKRTCEGFDRFAEHPGAKVQFTLTPGPGAKFYAGQRFGTDVLVLSDIVPLVLSPSQVELQIEPFRPTTGQHIRGTIDGTQHMLIGSA